ncbi:MAG TPA: NAD(P)-dependent oxidoreductase [Blastocatellia bacterium]|nr:NAD(P)-dependent oxidoreductase [Blastocatellia bacterium]
MRIGFIGLGIMGRPMALNLVKAGYALTVHNRTPSKCQPLVQAGAEVADSPREVASRSDVIITMVSDTPDVEAVLFGPAGVCEGIQPGTIVIDMSTVSPAATVEWAHRLREKDCELLDAPVTGGEKGARDATLTIMVGGSRSAYEQCLPIFHALGKTVIYTGPSGSGQKTKLVNQVICALNILAMVEGLQMARVIGLDLETTLRVVSSGAAASWMLTQLGPKILQNDFTPGFMIRLQHKDLRLVQELLRPLGLSLPGTELAFSLFSDAVARGLGEQGTQALIRLFPSPTEVRGETSDPWEAIR